MAHRKPARRARPSARPTTATAESWPTYAGTSGSTHGERKLSSPAPERRPRWSGPSGPSGLVAGAVGAPSSNVSAEQVSHLADARRPARRGGLPSSTTGIRSRNARCRSGSSSMLRSTRGGTVRPRVAPIGQHQLDRLTRLVAQPASGARVQDEIGEGRHARHRTSADASNRVAGSSWVTIRARAPVAQWTERSRPKAGVGGSSPSGGATPTRRRAASANLAD